MKKFLACVSLFTISSFIKAADDKATPTLHIVWKMGISGKLGLPGQCATPVDVPFVSSEVAKKPICTFRPVWGYYAAPLEVLFYRTAETDDQKKKLHLQPVWYEPTVIQVNILDTTYRTWDKVPDGTKIVLRYSETTKVAATMKMTKKLVLNTATY